MFYESRTFSRNPDGRDFDPLAQNTKGVDASVVTVRGPGVLPPFARGKLHLKEMLET